MHISKVSSGFRLVAFTDRKKLFIYPIKSIRGCEVQSALLTREGFHLDRRFMLLKDHQQIPHKLENMHVTRFPAMCLFHTAVKDNTLTVSYTPPGTTTTSSTLEIPLEPKLEGLAKLERVEVNMHSSPTLAYNMGEKYNAWFTQHFGFPVILTFWGLNPRLVLGNLPGRPTNASPTPPSAITKVLSSLPVFGPMLVKEEEGVIAFNDCAPYLVISDTSVDEVSGRLPEDEEMDLTKFRANIVVKGASSPWTEDFWSELTFSSPSHATPSPSPSPLSPPSSWSKNTLSPPKILLTGNCGRCASLNVDYSTGCPISDANSQPLKLLQKDRRVDQGTKYSPIFGRYGFASKASEGSVVRVGDEVMVSGKNNERTRFCTLK